MATGRQTAVPQKRAPAMTSGFHTIWRKVSGTGSHGAHGSVVLDLAVLALLHLYALSTLLAACTFLGIALDTMHCPRELELFLHHVTKLFEL